MEEGSRELRPRGRKPELLADVGRGSGSGTGTWKVTGTVEGCACYAM